MGLKRVFDRLPGSPLLALVAAFIQGCGQPSAATGSNAVPPPATVTVVSPAHADVSRLIELPADVQPSEEAVIYAKAAGYLQHIYVDKGDRVKEGQLLAVIQAPELLADQKQAQSAYEAEVFTARGSAAARSASLSAAARSAADAKQAQAEFEQASADLQKARDQIAQARETVRQAGEESVQAQAALKASQAEVAEAEANLTGARSARDLAVATYNRYQSIYDRDHQLIAHQSVETAQTEAELAKSRFAAAQTALTVARNHAVQADAQLKISISKASQAKSALSITGSDLKIATAGQEAKRQHLNAAIREVDVAGQQVRAATAKVGESKSLAEATKNASAKSTALAGYARVVAPFDGTVTKRFVDTGAFIQAASGSTNSAPIVTVANLDAVRVYVNVPEAEASLVHPGTRIRVSLWTDPKKPISGRVTRTSGALDPKSRTLLAEVDLPNRTRNILSGSYATVKVVLETHSNVLSLPSKAVGSEKSGRFVWVVYSGKAKHVAVQVGFDDGTRAEILEGLRGDEQVVADKLDAVTPGQPVRPSPISAQ